MNSSKKSNMIRAIMCAVVIVIVILGWTKIIPQIVGIIASSLLLCVVFGWNGIESYKEGRKHTAIFNFIMVGILLFLLAGLLIMKLV